MSHTYRIIFNCPDQIGIVTRVGQFITEHGGWISEASHHSDEENNRFFSRIVIKADSLPFETDTLREKFSPIANELDMQWRVTDSRIPQKVILMASKSSHCLSDLLDRWKSGDLACEIPCVISNHDDMRGLVEWYGIPYHHVPIEKENKGAGFREIETLIDHYQADTIVLARYMQIIPPEMCAKYQYQLINIHHSFLPSFIGGAPYQQACQRGVKLIGATCHYVTEQLDEGPIIEQDVVRVNHSNTVNDLVRLGKDVEKTVLARGIRAHILDQVQVHGNKTVVFND